MKTSLVVLIVLLECTLHLNCYKFADGDLVIPPRFMRKSDPHQLDDLLLSNNRQKSLFPDQDLISALNYQKTLDEIEAQANTNMNVNYPIDDFGFEEDVDLLDPYSEDLHFDDFIQNYDDDQTNDNLVDGFRVDPKDDEESETHSSLIAGHQYVSGGAGEGKQHLQPDGGILNKEEVKSDEDLPAYCDPPNPCPVGYDGEDCDRRPFSDFTAQYSKIYQERQNCMCDDDHNDCQKSAKSFDKISEMMMSNLNVDKKFSGAVAKKSPRVRRDVRQNPYLRDKAIRKHVAKKSAPMK